jgi:general secretion pathway protein H
LLLSLFASLTIPVLNRFGRDDLAWSARRIAGTVQFLFNEAAISGREHRLAFELQRNRLTAKVVEDDGEMFDLERWEERLVLPVNVKVKDIHIAGKGVFSTGRATIRILPGGFLEESLIHLSDRQKELTLRLNPFTGATEIREGYYDF